METDADRKSKKRNGDDEHGLRCHVRLEICEKSKRFLLWYLGYLAFHADFLDFRSSEKPWLVE
jgi:hypothetical protein